jgi:hypothetical protein
MTAAFPARFGEAWTRSQCAGILPMTGVRLMLAENGSASRRILALPNDRRRFRIAAPGRHPGARVGAALGADCSSISSKTQSAVGPREFISKFATAIQRSVFMKRLVS